MNYISKSKLYPNLDITALKEIILVYNLESASVSKLLNIPIADVRYFIKTEFSGHISTFPTVISKQAEHLIVTSICQNKFYKYSTQSNVQSNTQSSTQSNIQSNTQSSTQSNIQFEILATEREDYPPYAILCKEGGTVSFLKGNNIPDNIIEAIEEHMFIITPTFLKGLKRLEKASSTMTFEEMATNRTLMDYMRLCAKEQCITRREFLVALGYPDSKCFKQDEDTMKVVQEYADDTGLIVKQFPPNLHTKLCNRATNRGKESVWDYLMSLGFKVDRLPLYTHPKSTSMRDTLISQFPTVGNSIYIDPKAPFYRRFINRVNNAHMTKEAYLAKYGLTSVSKVYFNRLKLDSETVPNNQVNSF